MQSSNLTPRVPVPSFRPLQLTVACRPMHCQYAPIPHATSAVLWLPAPGDPSASLLQLLCSNLRQSFPTLLFAEPDWQYPMYVLEALHRAIDHLRRDGIATIALVGHALGATLCLWAAHDDPGVRTVVALAPTCLGPLPAAALGPTCSLLLIHGTADQTTSPDNSRHLYAVAREPKQLVLLAGGDHTFSNCLPQLRHVLRGWLAGELAAPRLSPYPALRPTVG